MGSPTLQPRPLSFAIVKLDVCQGEGNDLERPVFPPEKEICHATQNHLPPKVMC
jgi:hypothetical protein